MYKLVLEFKSVSELAETVARLGGVAEAGAVTATTTTTPAKKKSSSKKKTTEVEVQLPPNPAPTFDPGVSATAIMQQTAPAAPFNRQAALDEIIASLGKLSQAGVPESQIQPLIQREYEAVGAPAGTRMSLLPDDVLSRLAPRVKQVVDTQLSQVATPGIV